MPKIKMTNGIYRYKVHPIYTGYARMNKQIEEENLLIIKKILDAANIPFFLVGGTLLGAVREKDFIEHDDDIDLALMYKDKQRFVDLLPAFEAEGFVLARYDRHSIFSILRKGQFVDLDFFEKYDEFVYNGGGWAILKKFLDNLDYIEFKGELYLAPKDYEGYLESEYGENWRTPIKYFNFNRSKAEVFKIKIMEYIKAYLPDCIYCPLKNRADKKTFAKYMVNINKYLQSTEVSEA